MADELMKPKEASLRYGIPYLRVLEMCKDELFLCRRDGGRERTRWFIYVDEADKYMRSVGWRPDEKCAFETPGPDKLKGSVTNESSLDTLVYYIEENANIVKRKGTKTLKSILRDIQKGVSYIDYPEEIKRGVTILITACIDFDDSVDKAITLLYEDK